MMTSPAPYSRPLLPVGAQPTAPAGHEETGTAGAGPRATGSRLGWICPFGWMGSAVLMFGPAPDGQPRTWQKEAGEMALGLLPGPARPAGIHDPLPRRHRRPRHRAEERPQLLSRLDHPRRGREARRHAAAGRLR